jgi:hypothetical protein
MIVSLVGWFEFVIGCFSIVLQFYFKFHLFVPCLYNHGNIGDTVDSRYLEFDGTMEKI